MHIVFNDGAVFVGAIVIGGNAAGAIVHALAHCGIAQIGQVIGFGTFGHGGIFNFHKIANVHFGGQLRTGSKTCKGTNERALAHRHACFFAINVCEGMHHCACGNVCIGNDAVGADAHAVA